MRDGATYLAMSPETLRVRWMSEGGLALVVAESRLACLDRLGSSATGFSEVRLGCWEDRSAVSLSTRDASSIP